MSRSSFLLVLALSAVMASAVAAQGNLRNIAAAASKSTKDKGGKCALGTPAVAYVDGFGPDVRPGATDHPFNIPITEGYLANQPKPPILNHLTTTFDCVDSRETAYGGANPHLGTPGGDFAELATGIYQYYQSIGETPTEEGIKKIFEKFMEQVASPSRPFYLHTSEDKINKVLNDVAALLPDRPASLPVVGPPPGPLREAYIESLLVSGHQGCGHLRLMLAQPADYGLDSDFVPKTLLKVFYEYWWFTPVGSPQRKKIEYPILQGLLEGDAILVVNPAGKTGSCAKRSPSIIHAWWGGQAFVYNGAAVEDFRKIKLAEFFRGIAKSEGKTLPASYGNDLQALQTTQLVYTITNLGTAKDCPLLSVSY